MILKVDQLTTLRISGARICVELATNERRDIKPRVAKNWRGASDLMRGLGFDYLVISELPSQPKS